MTLSSAKMKELETRRINAAIRRAEKSKYELPKVELRKVKCLKCDNYFMSESVYYRQCFNCKRANQSVDSHMV